jgi:ketosteroid isomerase-like protein
MAARHAAGALAVLLPAVLAAGLALAAPRPIDSLIDAERAFSAESVERGMRPAFLDHLADDAVIFRPGPINGMQSWRDRRDAPGILEWAPQHVEISGSGDLGFSSGPWVYRDSVGAEIGACGHFITVWRRDPRGRWKVALDCGSSHPRAERGPLEVEIVEGPVHTPPDSNAWKTTGLDVGVGVHRGGAGFGVGLGTGGLGIGGGFANGVRSRADYEYRRTAHEKNTMMAADRALGWNARRSGWEEAYRAVAAGDLRFQRQGAAPTLGAEAAAAASAASPRDVTWEYRGNGVARSWDLGYVYGLAIRRAKNASRPDTSAFVHLWRKDDAGQWRMVTDWEGAFPRR